jgi:cell division protein FtsB
MDEANARLFESKKDLERLRTANAQLQKEISTLQAGRDQISAELVSVYHC